MGTLSLASDPAATTTPDQSAAFTNALKSAKAGDLSPTAYQSFVNNTDPNGVLRKQYGIEDTDVLAGLAPLPKPVDKGTLTGGAPAAATPTLPTAPAAPAATPSALPTAPSTAPAVPTLPQSTPAATPAPASLSLAAPAAAATPTAPAPVDRLALAKSANDIFAQSDQRQFAADLRQAQQVAAGGGQLGSGMLRGKLGDVALTHSSAVDADLAQRLNAAQTGEIADQQQAFENQIATSNLSLAQKTEALNEAVQTGQLTLAQKNEALNELQNTQQYGIAQGQLSLAQKSEGAQETYQSGELANQQAATAASTALGQGQLALAKSAQDQSASQFAQSLAQSASQFGQNLTLAQKTEAANEANAAAEQNIQKNAQTLSAQQFEQTFGLSKDQFAAQQAQWATQNAQGAAQTIAANFYAWLNSGGDPKEFDWNTGKPLAAEGGVPYHAPGS